MKKNTALLITVSSIVVLIGIISACGIPFLLPGSSQSYAFLRHLTPVAEMTVHDYEYDSYYSSEGIAISGWAPPQNNPSQVFYAFSQDHNYERWHYITMADLDNSARDASDESWGFLSGLMKDYQAVNDTIKYGQMQLHFLIEDNDRWGAGIMPLTDSTYGGVLIADFDSNDFPSYWLYGGRFYDDTTYLGDSQNPYRGLHETAVIHDNYFTDPNITSLDFIGSGTVSSHEFIGNDLSHAKSNKLFLLYLSTDTNTPTNTGIFEAVYDLSYDFNLGAAPTPASFTGPTQLTRLTGYNFNNYRRRGFYVTASGNDAVQSRSYLSLFNEAENVFHTFAWTRGTNVSVNDGYSAYRINVAGQALEGRLLGVLHDGTLLLKDDESGEWIFFTEGDSETKSFHPGDFEYIQEYQDTNNNWMISLRYSSLFNRHYNESLDQDVYDAFAGNYRIATSSLYELAGFTP